MSKSNKTKINYNSIRNTKSDYIKHFLRNKAGMLAVGLFSFLLGGLFIANMSVTLANSPTVAPPGGNVDGRFRNMNISNTATVEDLIVRGKIHDRPNILSSDVKYIFSLPAGNRFVISGPTSVNPNNQSTWGRLQLNNTLLQVERIQTSGTSPVIIGTADSTNRSDGVIIRGFNNFTHIRNDGISRLNSEGNPLPLQIRANGISVTNGKIGNYYTATRTVNFSSPTTSGEGFLAATCPRGQIVSCEAHSTSTVATSISHKTLIDSSNQCGVMYANALRVIIQARCFDPSGLQNSVEVSR